MIKELKWKKGQKVSVSFNKKYKGIRIRDWGG